MDVCAGVDLARVGIAGEGDVWGSSCILVTRSWGQRRDDEFNANTLSIYSDASPTGAMCSDLSIR